MSDSRRMMNAASSCSSFIVHRLALIVSPPPGKSSPSDPRQTFPKSFAIQSLPRRKTNWPTEFFPLRKKEKQIGGEERGEWGTMNDERKSVDTHRSSFVIHRFPHSRPYDRYQPTEPHPAATAGRATVAVASQVFDMP
jgi:hypothetical protein